MTVNGVAYSIVRAMPNVGGPGFTLLQLEEP
jgi:hypothetical protein